MDQVELGETHFNRTTPHVSPPQPTPGFHAYYFLVGLVLLAAAGCVVALVVRVRRRSRLVELRHRLIPVYSYDPTEVRSDWGEEEDLAMPLYKEGNLSLLSAYGT